MVIDCCHVVRVKSRQTDHSPDCMLQVGVCRKNFVMPPLHRVWVFHHVAAGVYHTDRFLPAVDFDSAHSFIFGRAESKCTILLPAGQGISVEME